MLDFAEQTGNGNYHILILLVLRFLGLKIFIRNSEQGPLFLLFILIGADSSKRGFTVG